MTPQMQLNGHDPDNGIFGDCHRTCIAMILDMQAIDVPNFYDGFLPDSDTSEGAGRAARQSIYDWLAPMGLTEFSFNVPGEIDLESALFHAKHWGNGAPVIIGGKSSLGGGHSCVAYDGQLHDPSGNGLVGPCSDGFWWFSVLAVAGDWKGRAAAPKPEPVEVGAGIGHAMRNILAAMKEKGAASVTLDLENMEKLVDPNEIGFMVSYANPEGATI